jgi:uncharacterized protein (DUF427 family)
MTTQLEDVSFGDGAAAAHVVRLEACPKRVRVYLGGVAIADSKRVMTLFETGHLPVYYFPLEDVRTDLLEASDHHTTCPYKGEATYHSIRAGERFAENAMWSYPSPIAGAPSELSGLAAFYWKQMDAWFEEDEEVFVHARDPYKRIDVLESSRHVTVEVGGEIVADTTRPCLLFETHLPVRYYIPKVDVRMELMVPSETTSQCPYKGIASYYSVKTGDGVAEDIAWYYPFPTEGCSKIANMVCFFNEKVDALTVDGEVLEKPRTAWS